MVIKNSMLYILSKIFQRKGIKMNSFKKLAMLTLAITAFGSASATSVDPIVGSWNIELDDATGLGFPDVQGVLVFHADGTFLLDSTASLGQPQLDTPPGLGATCGSFSTTVVGCWKQVSKDEYESTSTLVVAFPGPNPACPPALSSLGFPSNFPAFRLKIEAKQIKI